MNITDFAFLFAGYAIGCTSTAIIISYQLRNIATKTSRKQMDIMLEKCIKKHEIIKNYQERNP